MTLAVLVGAAIAWRFVDVDPLSSLAVAIPHRATISAQYAYAASRDTEEAWASVIDYFSNSSGDRKASATDQRYVQTAKQQLARWYLEQFQTEKAVPLLQDLTRLEDSEEYLRAFGYAGLVIAESQLGHFQEARAAADKLAPLRDMFLQESEADSFLRDSLARAEQALQ
ncbi:MAG TPA: hypothetical protein VIY86_05440 [Pirellulaceae bacterium]